MKKRYSTPISECIALYTEGLLAGSGETGKAPSYHTEVGDCIWGSNRQGWNSNAWSRTQEDDN